MGYNFFGETDKSIDWVKLNKRLEFEKSIEYIPMPLMGEKQGDAIGISIPSKNIKSSTWNELNRAIDILANEFNFEIYDMYFGAKLDSKLMDKIKENLQL